LNDLKGAWEAVRPASVIPAPVAAAKSVKASPVYAVPAVSPQSQAKTAPAVAAMRAPQPKAVAAAPMVTPQQRVANKVQALYGRV
jgi:hypothetical protein